MVIMPRESAKVISAYAKDVFIEDEGVKALAYKVSKQQQVMYIMYLFVLLHCHIYIKVHINTFLPFLFLNKN